MIETNQLDSRILQEGLDDWVPFGAADEFALHLEENPERRKLLVLTSIRSLVSGALLEIGDLSGDDSVDPRDGFVPWPGTLEEQLARIDEVYRPESSESDPWYWMCWLNNTPAGDALANAETREPRPEST